MSDKVSFPALREKKANVRLITVNGTTKGRLRSKSLFPHQMEKEAKQDTMLQKLSKREVKA